MRVRLYVTFFFRYKDISITQPLYAFFAGLGGFARAFLHIRWLFLLGFPERSELPGGWPPQG
jgi:hypothetical protein